MALRARLAAPPTEQRRTWPWHVLDYRSVSVSAVVRSERRLDAETYLSSGYGIRASIEARKGGWSRFGDVARSWAPPRIKTILVSPEYGTPYLNTSQVFEYRPAPRKWLAMAKIVKAESRLAKRGTILLMASASVGRSALVTRAHEGCVLSHHFMRVDPIDPTQHGWIYAFLRSPQARAMMSGSQYASIIRHIEPRHVDTIPIPTISPSEAAAFNARVLRILELRDKGQQLALAAESLFEKVVGPLSVSDWGEQGFAAKASALFRGRRRFDASIHSPGVATIRRHLAVRGKGVTTVSAAGFDIWLPNRFARVPAKDGVLLVDSGSLVEANPDLGKRIAETDFGDPNQGRVETGWLLLARSGQVYGILGTAVLATDALAGQIISDDVIRVAPKAHCDMRVGYLLVALSHPVLGRPLIKAIAYGSSIPHIDPSDFAEHEVVRLDPGVESAIADLAEGAAKARAEADVLERAIAEDAGTIVNRFITR